MLENLIDDLNDKIANLSEHIKGLKQDSPDDSSYLLDLVHSDEWPLAVSPHKIINEASEEQKAQRAAAITRQLDLKIDSFSFLDFGCGEGYVADVVARIGNAKSSIGYDVVDTFKKDAACILTCDRSIVQEHGPYDVVLLHDVVDHIDPNSVVNELKFIKSILSPKGSVFVKCHPWCSRHGSHLYREMNKAFVHLIFTEKELQQLGISVEHTVSKVLYPVIEYSKWFAAAGFKMRKKPVQTIDGVETFFRKESLIRRRLMKLYSSNHLPTIQMQQSFVDFVLF